MSFRDFVGRLEKEGKLVVVNKEVSHELEAASVLSTLGERPGLLKKIKGFDSSVVGNVFATKALVADYLGCSVAELIPRMVNAIDHPSKPEITAKPRCQEVVEKDVDLDKVPILLHLKQDGGRYVASGIMIVKDPELGQNVSFHRAMQFSKNRFAMRLLPRHTYQILEKNGGEIDACFCIGCGANVLLAGAMSVKLGQDELEIANTLKSFEVAKAVTNQIVIPSDAEWVFEGTLTMKETHSEGPFLDLTETLDTVRDQPVFIVKKITHRKDPLWHALLPGGLEHKVMMGMPREPTIFREVGKVCKCIDVNVNPGGCSWLHSIVKIDKAKDGDGKEAIKAAFRGHSSMKLAMIVDRDIDIYDPLEVEWALATRFQFDKDVVVIGREPGSSLDPSAEAETKMTMKVGFDMTRPLAPPKGKDFSKLKFSKADLNKYL